MSESQTTEKRTSSAELKKQIDEATKSAREQKTKSELVQSGLPLPAIADRINANSTTENPKTESKSEPAQPPAQPATEQAVVESTELNEWKKKKGISWDTPDNVAIELRKLDQEFHRKRAEEKKQAVERPPQANGWTPPPPYQPPYQSVNPYPAYAPPNNRAMVESLARQYNMTPEDFERVTAVQRDLTMAMIEQERQRRAKIDEEMTRENIKNSEFRELSADPVFRRPEVAKEFHEILEKTQESDPESFSQDPYAFRKVFGQALQNIARRNLEGQFQDNGSPSFQLPKTPPKPLGNGAGGGREMNENALTQEQFAKLPSSEQRKYLEGLGLVQPKY